MNRDEYFSTLIEGILTSLGLDAATARETMIVIGAQAEEELRTASAYAESYGEEPWDFKALEERKHAAMLRGREWATEAALSLAPRAGHA